MTVKQIICKMSNPATLPTPVKDVQGDNRWMSMVRKIGKRRLVSRNFDSPSFQSLSSSFPPGVKEAV